MDLIPLKQYYSFFGIDYKGGNYLPPLVKSGLLTVDC